MALVMRMVVGILSALTLLNVYQHWFRLPSLVSERGLIGVGDVGAANIRADIGGIFLSIAVFLGIAAWKQSRMWIVSTLIVIGCTLSGRLVSFALDGFSARTLEPVAIEVVVISILLATLWAWREKAPEGL